MGKKLDDESYLTFVDLRPYVEQKLGMEDWVTLYEIEDSPGVKSARYCALVSPDHLTTALSEFDWDLHIGSTGLGFVEYGNGGGHQYVRVGDEPVEPFVHWREFSGMREPYVEVSEEFRHFHNLYEDKKTGALVAFDEAGDEIPVVRITDQRVQVRLGYIKEYLTARDMCLLAFFEFDRYCQRSMAEIRDQKDHTRGADGRVLSSLLCGLLRKLVVERRKEFWPILWQEGNPGLREATAGNPMDH